MAAPSIDRVAAPAAAVRQVLPAVVVVLLGLLTAAALPFAPVLAQRATLTWPVPGVGGGGNFTEPPVSTTAFFAPYRPATLDVTVPCADRPGTLFATGPDGVGLAVRSAPAGTAVELGGRIVAAGPGCGVTVAADEAGVVVELAGARTVLPGEPVPEVLALRTDLVDAAGLAAVATTASPWQTTPTPTKRTLLALHLLTVLLALALLRTRRPPGGRKATSRALVVRNVAFLPRLPGLLLDVGVVGALGVWAVVGPLTDDDGFAAAIVGSVLEIGDAGNYYRWWNASETPFALCQQLLAPWLAVSAAPLWLRLPSTLLGIATWLVVSRGVLGVLAPGRLGVRALAALFLLAAWLPVNLGIRPEPWVAFGVVAVLALLLRARTPAGVGLAALVAGLTVPMSPTGLLVLAPGLACVPRIGRILGAAAGRREVAVRVGLVAVAGSVAATAVFADQTWYGLRTATELHTGFGPALPWYAELTRYVFLLGDNFDGSFARRVPVLLGLALLATVAAILLRRGRDALGAGVAPLAVSVGAAFVLLVPLPSKWSHHFGALAGLLAVFAAVAVTGLWRTGGRAGLVGAGLTSAAAAVAFTGPNAWWQPVNYPLPWATGPVRPGGLPLDSPLLWLVLGVLAVVLARRRGSRDGQGKWSGCSGAAPAGIAVTAAGLAVALLLGAFGTAPLRRPDGYTLASANLDRLTGRGTCALADAVQVLPDVPGGVLQVVADGPALDPGWVAGGGFRPDLTPFDAPGRGTFGYLWGSHGSIPAVGDLVTPWFGLPARDGRQVALSVAGRIGAGTSLELEFGRAGAPLGRVVPAASNMVDPARIPADVVPGRQPGLDPVTTGWRTVAVDADTVPPDADQVRIRAVDAAVDIDGWLATTGPRLRDVVVLSDFLATRGPVLVDWPIAFVLPCVRDRPRVGDGLAAAPTVRLTPPAAYGGLAGITAARGQGGSFLGVAAQARAGEVPSRLVGAPELEWGHVMLIDHGLAVDAYRLSRSQVVTWGWDG